MNATISSVLTRPSPFRSATARSPMPIRYSSLTLMSSIGNEPAAAASGQHESFVSSALSDFADAAFVGKWKRREGETKVSARARRSIPVPLNEVMMQVGKEFGGAGGGHAKAAGASAKGKPEIVLKRCVEILTGRL